MCDFVEDAESGPFFTHPTLRGYYALPEVQRRAQLTRLRLRSLEKIELLHEVKGELFEPKKFEQFFFVGRELPAGSGLDEKRVKYFVGRDQTFFSNRCPEFWHVSSAEFSQQTVS